MQNCLGFRIRNLLLQSYQINFFFLLGARALRGESSVIARAKRAAEGGGFALLSRVTLHSTFHTFGLASADTFGVAKGTAVGALVRTGNKFVYLVVAEGNFDKFGELVAKES